MLTCEQRRVNCWDRLRNCGFTVTGAASGTVNFVVNYNKGIIQKERRDLYVVKEVFEPSRLMEGNEILMEVGYSSMFGSFSVKEGDKEIRLRPKWLAYHITADGLCAGKIKLSLFIWQKVTLECDASISEDCQLFLLYLMVWRRVIGRGWV